MQFSRKNLSNFYLFIYCRRFVQFITEVVCTRALKFRCKLLNVTCNYFNTIEPNQNILYSTDRNDNTNNIFHPMTYYTQIRRSLKIDEKRNSVRFKFHSITFLNFARAGPSSRFNSTQNKLRDYYCYSLERRLK